jgi:hypothetical protein
MKRITLILLISLGACDESAQLEEPKTLCEQVSDKLYECIGGRVPITYCSQETADYILNAPCEDVLEFIRGSQR